MSSPSAIWPGMAGDLDGASSDDVYNARAQRKARLALGTLAIFALLVVGGAVLVPIRGAIVAPAQLAPESQVKRIAHPTGGVVAEIAVADGAQVEKGQLLVSLDSNVTSLDAELSLRSLEQLVAQRARLTAEMEDRPLRFPAELAARHDDAAIAAMRTETRRLHLDRAEMRGLAAQMRERSNQLDRQIEGFRAQIDALRRQQALIAPELEGLREMKRKGYATIARVNQLERTAVELEGAIGALEANIAQNNAAIAENEQQRIQIAQSARARAGEQLAQVEAALNQQRVASADAGLRRDRAAIRAPYAGTVVHLAITSIGEVVQPGTTIMEIVPRDDELIFVGAIAPSDIDRVRSGQSARVRLSAFNRATTPEVRGKVTYVAADPTQDKTSGRQYYHVRVALDPSSREVTERLGLVSGMPGELFIDAGSRSMLSYVTKPLRDQFARAFLD